MSNPSEVEESALKHVLIASVNEQRRRRRWGIFFKIIYLVLILCFLALVFGDDPSVNYGSTQPHIGLVDVVGPIMDNADANADDIVYGLTSAFENPNSKGVILRINSPGGSPVQSDYVYNAMQRLQAKYPKKKLYAVCVDMCASGAYYMAAAADKIYANPSSMVGSIGVLLNGFGFVDTLDKLGIQRRLITSGQNKGFLDPFSPLKPSDEAHAKIMLDEVHAQFIDAVKKGRNDRLKTNDPNLFSGIIWTGERAKNLGLIDEFGSAGDVAREVFKLDTVVNYSVEEDFFQRFSRALGTQVVNQTAVLLGIDATGIDATVR